MLEVGCDQWVVPSAAEPKIRVDAAKDGLPGKSWQLRSQGHGAKGLRMRGWAWLALDSGDCPDGWRRSLLIRRDREDEDQWAYFLCYHRRGTTLTELVAVAGRCWGIEESFAITKSEAGLDEHQVRKWIAWYRHAILAMLAAAFPAAMRACVPANPTAWTAG